MPSLLQERTEAGLNPRQAQAARASVIPSYVTRLGRTGRGLLGIALLALIWELVPQLGLVNSYFLPPLHKVLHAWWHLAQDGELWKNLRASLVRSAAGFGLATVVAVPTGAAIAWYRPVRELITPPLEVFRNTAALALLPVFTLILGIGETSKIAIAATMVAFVVFYNVYYGMRTVRTELAQLVTLMGGRHIDTLRYVTLPSLVTPFFAGLKAGGPLAIIGVVIGEFLASFNGVGHLLFVDGNDLNSAGVFSGIVILVVIALILNGLLSLLDGLVSRMLGLSVPRGGARHRTAVAVAVETAESEGVQPDAASIAESGSTTPPDTTHANHGRTKP